MEWIVSGLVMIAGIITFSVIQTNRYRAAVDRRVKRLLDK